MLSRFLENLFRFCGLIAALFLVLMLLLIVTQVVGRIAGFPTPGITNYAGYCMAASSFFGLSYAMHHNTHIRVSLFLNISSVAKWWLELWCHLIAVGLSIYFCYFAIKATYWSYTFHDVSQGQDATPIWIPQLVMCAGTFFLALVLIERLVLLFVKPDDDAESTLEKAAG